MTRKFTIEYDGLKYCAVNATISSTFLGIEDHGIMTFSLTCSWEGGGVSVGNRTLDTYSEEEERRVGSAYGLDAIMSVLDTLGVRSWEDLVGQKIIVLFNGPSPYGSLSAGISHLTDEKRVMIFRNHSGKWNAERAKK